MIQIVSNHQLHERRHLYTALFISLLFTISMVVLRVFQTNSPVFVFLIWNLILAAIPFLISNSLKFSINNTFTKWMLIPLLTLWLLFFPNAPYIITDLFHLKSRAPIPMWYDTILLFSAAWNGMLLAFISLYDIENIVKQLFKATVSRLFVVAALVLSSLGIYIGRYLRWNSWDIIMQPQALIIDVMELLINPAINFGVLKMILLFTAFLLTGYLIFRSLLIYSPTNVNVNEVNQKSLT